jgi:hypothetical protein
MSAPATIAALNCVCADFERSAEPVYRKKIDELVPTGITIIGIRVPAIRKVAQASAPSQQRYDTENGP